MNELTGTKKKTDSFLATFANVGGSIAYGALSAAGAGVAALGGFLASSIGPASDLNETISKNTVVFGESADQILEWGKTAADTLGMSQNSALAAAATYGNLFRAMDIGEESSANMSTGLVELAGDLASFNNMDPTEVLDKLRAGISGESEPLKSLGVNINEALLKQRALEMGLYDGVGALDAASKAQAAYSLIMEQTTLAQGDFARTSGGLANQQRILAAKFEDIRAKVGTALLPVITKLATTLSDYLSRPEVIVFIDKFTEGIGNLAQRAMEALPGVISGIQSFFTFLQNNEGIVIGILAALGVAVATWAVMTVAAAWAVVTAPPVLAVIAVLLAIGVAAYLLYQAWTNNWGGIQDKLKAVWAVVQPVLQNLWNWLSTNIPVVIQGLAAIWENVLLPAIQLVWGFISENLIPLFQAIGELIGSMLMPYVNALANLWGNVLWPAMKSSHEWFMAHLFPGLKSFAEFLVGNFIKSIEWVGDAFQKVIGFIQLLTKNLNSIELPSWMTPGSPTPWEIGLLGVGDALRHLANSEMPAFRSALQLQAEPVGVGPLGTGVSSSALRSAQSGNGGGLTFNINVTSDGITDERDVARKIASAVEVVLRERGLA